MNHTTPPWYPRQTGLGVVHLLQSEKDDTALGSINTMADAAYIVRAVNSYEIMLNALKKIADSVEGHEESCGCNCCSGPENIAKQAIAKAESR